MTLLLQMFVKWDSGGAFLREGKRQFSVLNVLITTEANLNIKKKKHALESTSDHITMEQQKPTPIYEHGFHFWRQLHTHVRFCDYCLHISEATVVTQMCKHHPESTVWATLHICM